MKKVIHDRDRAVLPRQLSARCLVHVQGGASMVEYALLVTSTGVLGAPVAK